MPTSEDKIYSQLSKFPNTRYMGSKEKLLPELYKTFAELSTKEKNRLSHRSIAVTKLVNFLVN